MLPVLAQVLTRTMTGTTPRAGRSDNQIVIYEEFGFAGGQCLEACFRLRDKGLLDDQRMQFSIVVGVRGGIAATADNLLTMVRRLPRDSLWHVVAVGKMHLPLTAIALALGGNARAGWRTRSISAAGNSRRAINPSSSAQHHSSMASTSSLRRYRKRNNCRICQIYACATT